MYKTFMKKRACILLFNILLPDSEEDALLWSMVIPLCGVIMSSEILTVVVIFSYLNDKICEL